MKCSKEPKIKTERDVEIRLGITTEPQQPSTSGVSNLPSNNWQKEKEGLLHQIADLKTELQRVALDLSQQKSKLSSLSLEKDNLKEQISNKETVLLKEKEEVHTLLLESQAKFDKLKEEDAKNIAVLMRENKMLKAQQKQIQSGISYRQSFENSQKKSTSNLDATAGNDEYDVEAIIDHKGGKSNRQYLVRWKGFGPADDTWEYESNFVIEALKEYKKNNNL